jgi:putative ABC transport system permease protein
MRQLIALGRGLVHRAGSAVLILVVAVVAAAAAAAGPVYYQAALHSILAGDMSGVPFLGRGYEATTTGLMNGTLASLRSEVTGQLDHDLGAPAAKRLFEPPVESIEGSYTDSALAQTFLLVWRTDFCAHLVITGHCPTRPGQVIVSKSDTGPGTGWHIGSQIRGSGWPTLTITGVYQPPDAAVDYWVLRAGSYFPIEDQALGANNAPGLDAAFTDLATISAMNAGQQGTSVIDDRLALARIQASDVGPLAAGMTAFANSVALTTENIVPQTIAQSTLAGVESGWRAVAVPVTLTTLTLLLLSWLLLFLIVTEAVEARGPEIALAKLRGHGRLGILLFGLSEPAVILLAALPIGLLVGWVAADQLAGALLLPHTPVGLPWTALAAAAAAVAGGFAAVILAAQRALRRGVVQQFRRPSRLANSRGWVLDSILLTASVAGLAEVLSTRQIGTASRGVLDLLVPGLLGLAVAVVAARLLPLICRALYGVTSRHGGLAGYLALRHIARREGGVRTTIVLATAFSLAAFAFAAWSVGQRNYQLVASARVGAPEVLTVEVPAGHSLSSIVAKADPSGRLATAVDTYIGVSGGTAGEYTIAVDPARFARIASWPELLSQREADALTSDLSPPAAAPIVLAGNAVRVTVNVSSLSVAGEQLYANVTTGASPVTFGALPRHGTVTLTGSLTGCPCVLQSLALTLPGGQLVYGGSAAQVSAKLAISALDVRRGGRWLPAVPSSRLDSAATWRDETADESAQSNASSVASGARAFTWTIADIPSAHDPTLGVADVPSPLPAIVARPLLTSGQPLFTGNGLDGSLVEMRALAALPWVPAAPPNGVIVDQRYAQLEAGGNLSVASQQVWLAAGALPLIRPKLLASGVRILSVSSIASSSAQLQRQGPALASALFLSDAAAAALLAAGAAILGLYASARRRRYEYAAMEASGVHRRTLRWALLIELAVVLGFGVLVGCATGLGAARFVLRSVPEFTSTPTEPTLNYVAAAGPLTLLLGVAAALLAGVAVLSSLALVRGVRADLLREGQA